MKLLNDLLGFVALTGPLWLILVLLSLAIWIAARVAKRFKRPGSQLVGGAGIFLFVICVPFADEIAGRIYLTHLCTTEAGVRVYRAVELPSEYWDKDGQPKFLKPNGDLDKTMLGNRFSEPSTKEPYSIIFGIDNYRQQVVDGSTYETMGEVINFLHWGGWVSRSLSPNPSAVDCKDFHGNKFWSDFHLSLFIKPISVNK